MRNYKDVDIVKCLKTILNDTTEKHQMDFKFDIIRIFREAQKTKDTGEARHLLWMARYNGTWCVPEANVYIREAPENKIWCGYQHEPDGICAFAIEITDVRDNNVVGNVYELVYSEHIKTVSENLFDAEAAVIELRNGESMRVELDKFNYYRLQLEHDSIKRLSYVLVDGQGFKEFLAETRSIRNTFCGS